MWTWFSDPFGTTAANTNPAGAGTFIYNLRFPGQIYDSQAGLQQNYFRDYDPAIGRYIEADPLGTVPGIGLSVMIPKDVRSYFSRASLTLRTALGLNPLYTYVRDNPINRIDPRGLDDYSNECVGRYSSCGVTQVPGSSTIWNWLRLQVCKRSINQACATAPMACCEEESRQCYADAAGDEKTTVQCTVAAAMCAANGGGKQ
jgi:RHS repeat-associated protein